MWKDDDVSFDKVFKATVRPYCVRIRWGALHLVLHLSSDCVLESLVVDGPPHLYLPGAQTDEISHCVFLALQLSADVYRVHSLLGAEPLVLFRGGALRNLDALLSEPQQEIETILTEDEKIMYVYSHR